MGPGIIKNIIIGIILMVLAFVVGSMAADGAKGSLMLLGGIVGTFVLLYLGKNCWWLIFVTPPVLTSLTLSTTTYLPIPYLACIVVLVYWIILRMLGHVKIVWHSVVWLDLIAFVVFAYFAYSFYSHPVELMIFSDEDTEYVGGKQYVYALAALACYVVMSIIPCSIEKLNKVLKWTLLAQIAAILILVVKYRSLEAGRWGSIIFLLFSCKYSLVSLVVAPWKLLLLLFSLSLTLYGQREVLVNAAFTYMGISLVKRQMILLMLAAASTIGILTYLSSEDVLVKLPARIQRTLYVLPWLKIKEEIAIQVQHSSDWRKEMWRWAMDPRTKYIKDYVWGDGFGQSMKLLRLTTISLNRGVVESGDQQRFAESGTWHSGIFTTIHRLGFVGLGIFVIWHLAAFTLIIRVCRVLDKRKQGLYVMYYTLPYFGASFTFYISAGTITGFLSHFYMVGMAKIAYSEAIKTGIMPPMFSRQQYIPLAIREMEGSQAPATR